MTDVFDRATDFLINDPERNAGLYGQDKMLAVLGCRLALPLDPEPLADLLRQALADGTTVELLDAAFMHAIGYLGVVRVIPAHRVFIKLARIDQVDSLGVPEIAMTHQERVKVGTVLYDRFDPGRAAKQGELFEIVSERYYPMAMEFAGVTLAHPAMDARQRQIMTLAMLSCLGGQSAQLTFHAGVALDRGVSLDELAAILITVQAFAGLPRANAAALLIRELLLARSDKA